MPTSTQRVHGPALRAARERSGVSIAVLAQAIGRDASYLSRIELGQRQPSPPVLLKLCTWLGVSVDELTTAPEAEAVSA